MKTLKFNIACINQCTEAEGPAKRLAIWFQGCDKRCAGCCNPQLFDFNPAHILPFDELLQIIARAKERFGIEGISYLGGEPTLQQGLAELSSAIRSAGLGVILFTGKQAEDIPDDLHASVDLIVDGGFEQDKPDEKRNLIGSTNQRLIFITERYRPHEQWFYTPRPKRVEINFAEGLYITGDAVLSNNNGVRTMTETIKKKILEFAKARFDYRAKDAVHIFDAFNVEKLPDSSNSGDYKYSALATLGDSVAGLLLCEGVYLFKRKGEITTDKLALQNKVFDKVSAELRLPDYRYDGERFGEQPKEAQFKDDPSALFEAVLGAIYKDLGLQKTQALWESLFYPLIDKYKKEIVAVSSASDDSEPAKVLNFAELNATESEIYVCRFHKWNRKTKDEIKTGVLWFDKSAERGFAEQGLFFYKNATAEAEKEYSELSGKSPDCVIVYKLTLADLPKARCAEIDTIYDTELVEVASKERCWCLKVKDAAAMGNLSTQVMPYMVLQLPDNGLNGVGVADDIATFSKQYGIPVLTIW